MPTAWRAPLVRGRRPRFSRAARPRALGRDRHACASQPARRRARRPGPSRGLAARPRRVWRRAREPRRRGSGMSALRREALDRPPAAGLVAAPIAQPVVQTVGALLPELDALDVQAIAAPVLGARQLAVAELLA